MSIRAAVALVSLGIAFAGILLTLGARSQAPREKTGEATVEKSNFGTLEDGTVIEAFTLRNVRGAMVKVITYGGTLTALWVPDKNGKLGDVVFGFDGLKGYLGSHPYFGSTVGRYANRIAKGKFSLDGKEYTLAINNGPNSLHGGLKGFDKVVWEPSIRATQNGAALQLKYLSKDGEEGFPGNLSVTALYTLTDDNGLRLDYIATTDKDTILNLTEHSYFNLAGKGDVLQHTVMIAADKFTPVDSTSIPTGELRPVEGTPFDFRKPTAIGARIDQDDEQLKFGNGYDHNFVLNRGPGELALAARVYEPTTGRLLEVLTTQPGLQFYTGNFLDGTLKGKGGWVYQRRNGFCMEAQHFPDSPNHPNFPSVVLKPGEVYRNTIIYRLSV